MVSKDRLTAQGIRDLNYYGPRKARAAEVATVADGAPEAPATAPPIEATAIASEIAVPVVVAD